MSSIDAYLDALAAELHVRGVARRRFLRECRDHLADAAADRGEAAAVHGFGPPAEIAAAFDAEVAARRGLRATWWTAAAVLAMGGSTLALIQASVAGADAPALWAVVFIVAAQVSGVAAFLAVWQALADRRSEIPPADAQLLARRNACALIAAGLTMFAAGAAVPGRGSALLLLAGPVLVVIAFGLVLRARRLARSLDPDAGRPVRLPVPVDPRTLLVLTTCLAALAAFSRDLLEHATPGQALLTALIEATAVIACFTALGRRLGLR